jgi:pimeloyl-ACP methyl ester carboxylesterase
MSTRRDWSRRAVLATAPALLATAVRAEGLARAELFTTADDGLRIHVREVSPRSPRGIPLILIHGARAPGVASFDLSVPGGSLAADLATRLNRRVYLIDARGYGGSQRPAAMDQPPERSRPLSRAHEVIRDLDAVARLASKHNGGAKVGLVGWATGGLWAGWYAALKPETVAGLVTLNALYGGSDVHAMLGPGSAFAQPGQPRRFDPATGGYALYPGTSLLDRWNSNIPIADKDAWRDPAMAKALAEAALASDPKAAVGNPPRFRAPLGALEDSFHQACGRKLYDAGSITAPALLIRSGADFWSRRADVEAFVADAERSPKVTAVEIPDATHFVHLDRPERGRDRLLAELTAFFEGLPA